MDLKAFKKAARNGIEITKPKRFASASGEVPQRKPWEADPRCSISGCNAEAFHMVSFKDLCDHHFDLVKNPPKSTSETACERCTGVGVTFARVTGTASQCPDCLGSGRAKGTV